MSDAIEISGLSKQFGEFLAVDNVSLNVKSGEIFALLGVNGAGKSTLIKIMSCLSQPTSGEAKIFGLSVKEEPQKIKQLINLSPQETAIAKNLTVYENIKFIGEVYGLKKEEIEKKVNAILENLSLIEVKDKKAKLLSGGMQRRLSIAMALISEPKLLFLDEPTLGLDVIARRELWHYIELLKSKITIILTTHYLEEAENLADRIGIINKGQIIAVGSANDLIEKSGAKNFEDAFVKLVEEAKK